MGYVTMLFQFFAALLFSMVAGSVFGIWRGYDPTALSAASFLEMHQGAVRGLNVLLPGIALVAILLTAALGWLARGKGAPFWLYLAAALLMVGAGVVTRFLNQPINAMVMGWSAETMPADWQALRAAWWNCHLFRTAFSITAMALLLAAIILDRPA